MSYKDDFLAIGSRKQRYPLNPSSSRRASSSTWTLRHRRICSSTSLPAYTYSSQDDFDDADHLGPLSEITLDSDLDQRSSSSPTLFSPCLSSSPSADQLSTDDSSMSLELESHRSLFPYPLHEPGQQTAQRIQRLRARTMSVILTIPATSEDIVDFDEDEDEDEDKPREAVASPSAGQVSKLRRIRGVRDLRRAFHDADHGPVHFASTSSFALSKASYELGILVTPTPPLSLSHLSPRSSLRTLVDARSILPRSSGDLKTLCESTFSSVSTVSRFPTKVQSAFLPSLSSQYTDRSQPKFPRKFKYPVHGHNPSTPRPYRHVSLHQDTRLSRFPGEAVWSCAKISQSDVKRTARRGHTPRRVFSNPVAGLLAGRHIPVSPLDL